MRYKVNTLEVTTTSTGKNVAKCELIDELGVAVPGKVSIWGDFPNFQNVTFGSIVEGDLIPAKDPKYGPTLYPPKPVQSPAVARSGGFGGGMGAKLMEKKAESISKTMDRKEWGIMVSSTMRDAVLIATTITNNSHIEQTTGDMKDLILHWRKWLLENWDVEQPNLPF